MSTRLERLKEYAAEKGPRGASRDKRNLNYWSNRASENSFRGSRTDGREPPTEGRKDKNFVGSSDYMPGVRRTES